MILFMCRLVVVRGVLYLRIIKMSRKFSYVLTKCRREDKKIGKIEKKTIMNWGKKKTIMETKIQAGLHLLQSRDTVRLKPFTF